MTTRCPFCPYPRTGLGDDAPCPECGAHPLAHTPALADEPPERRRRIARGATLALVVMAVRGVHAIALVLTLLLAAPAFPGVLVAGLLLAAGLNASAGFQITSRTLPIHHRWVPTAIRAVVLVDLAVAVFACVAVFTPIYVALETIAVTLLAAGFLARSALMAGVVRMLAVRLGSDKLQAQLRGWLKYAGIAAMTPIVAVVAAAPTALIPILVPFTLIAAVPYVVFVGVLVVIALVGSIVLNARLARDLAAAV